jgi:uncharacterized membrane protein YfbV (UPF0208 family)
MMRIIYIYQLVWQIVFTWEMISAICETIIVLEILVTYEYVKSSR